MSEQHPEMYDLGIQIEDRIGKTFRSPSRDTWAADLRGLRAEFQSGRVMRQSAQAKRAEGNCDRDLFCRVCTL